MNSQVEAMVAVVLGLLFLACAIKHQQEGASDGVLMLSLNTALVTFTANMIKYGWGPNL